mgnify:FL=1|jgi:hypothetical protein
MQKNVFLKEIILTLYFLIFVSVTYLSYIILLQ